MISVEFSLSAILAIILVVLDKAGKLTVPILLVLLFVAAALAIHPAIANPWVRSATDRNKRYTRAGLFLSVVVMVFAALGIWIYPGTKGPLGDVRVSSQPAPIPPSGAAGTAVPRTQTSPPSQPSQKQSSQGNANTQNQNAPVTLAPCSNYNQGGNDVQQNVTCGPPKLTLAPEKLQLLISALQPMSGKNMTIIVVTGNSDLNSLRDQFLQACQLNQIACPQEEIQILNPAPPEGVSLFVQDGVGKADSDDVNALAKALISAGLSKKPVDVTRTMLNLNGGLGVVIAPTH